jgi:hypothetical protein
MILLIIAVLFFIAALLGLITIYLGYAAVKASPAYELKKRLRTLALDVRGGIPSDLKIEILADMSRSDKFLYKFKHIRTLHALIDKAGFRIDVKIFLLVVAVIAAAGFVIGAALRRDNTKIFC